MSELIEVLTKFLKEATLYLAMQNNPLLRISQTTEAPATIPPLTEPTPPKKERKPRAPKDEIAPTAPLTDNGLGLGLPSAPPASASAPATGELSEAESLALLYKVAAAFIQRDNVEASMAARQTYAKKHLADTYKVGGIKDLPHPQRLQLIAWLKAETAKA